MKARPSFIVLLAALLLLSACAEKKADKAGAGSVDQAPKAVPVAPSQPSAATNKNPETAPASTSAATPNTPPGTPAVQGNAALEKTSVTQPKKTTAAPESATAPPVAIPPTTTAKDLRPQVAAAPAAIKARPVAPAADATPTFTIVHSTNLQGEVEPCG